MRFRDRADAGEQLAAAARDRIEGPAVVLGVPRGGVLVAAPVARALNAPLDVVVPRKLGAPHNPELGIGAVAPGVVVIDERMLRRLRVPPGYVEAETARQEHEVEWRTLAYRGDRPPLDLAGRAALVVDDGIATGATMTAALRWAGAQHAAAVWLAVPVAPPATVRRLARDCTGAIVLLEPPSFGAVGEWYVDFAQTTDEEVLAALAASSA